MLTDYIIETIGYTRKNFLDLTAQCTAEEMNTVPKGFGNNLIWNLGHVIASQQVLCYVLSSAPPRVEDSFIDTYKPSTVPGAFIDQLEIDRIREMSASTVARMASDYQAGIFKTYTQRQTRYGVLLTNIDEAISYVSSHEALHYGYARAMVRLLRSHCQ